MVRNHIFRTVCVAVLMLLPACSAEPADPPGSGPEAIVWKEHGRWRPVHDATAPVLDDEGLEDGLRALPYLSGYHTAPDRAGVTVHDEERAFPGLNLYTSGHASEAGIMDMRGRILHRWTHDPDARFAAQREAMPPKFRAPFTHWRRTLLLGNGDLLGLYGSIRLIRLGRDSTVRWESDVREPHHHLQVDGDGLIYVLSTRTRSTPELYPRRDLRDDVICVLDGEGKVLRRHSLYEAFRNSRWSSVLDKLRRQGEVFHTNTIQVFDGSLESVSPHYRKGNVLVSILYMNMIAILNLDENRVVWALNGTENGLWDGMHEPTVLADGKMLIFDNGWAKPGVESRSRIVEYEPFTGKVFWKYEGDAEHPFYSPTCGTCQRLGNGNTLITETDQGRAFEVTKEGEIVWEYVSPHRAGEKKELIASLFHVERLDPARVPWLTVR